MGERPKVIVLLAAVGVGLAAGGAGAQQATPERSVVTGVASAQGVRATVRATGFIVEELADSGGPVAQALVDPQDSKSFASLPYPGENTVAFPGVVAAIGGPTLPAYTFYAGASTSEPESEVADPSGAYRLKATASPGAAAGTATLSAGGDTPASSASAGATVVTEGDRTTSRAEAVLHGLVFGDGALRIASLRSFSETVFDGGAETKSVSDLLIEGGVAGPMSFTYGPDGLSVAQQGVPTPSADALASLNAVLEPAGLSIGFVRAHDVAGGRASEVLVVEQAGDVANGSRSVARFRLGETSSALVLADALPQSPPFATEPPVPVSAEVPTAAPVRPAAPAAPTAEPPAPVVFPPGAGTVRTPPSSSALPMPNTSAAMAPAPIVPSPEHAAPTYDTAAPSVAAAPSPGGMTPRRISAVEPLSGLLVAGAAAMVAVALLWTKRGALTP